MTLSTTLNSLSIGSLNIEQYGFVNESDGGDDLLSRKLALIDDESLNGNEAHVCLGKHGFNSTLDSGEDECYERISKTLKEPSPEKYECCDHEANCSILNPYETDHEAKSFLYSNDTDHEAYSFFLNPYETDHEAYSFFLNPYETDHEANSYPYETREVENKTKSTLHSQFQGGDLLSRMSVGSLGLESYGFISTPDSLMKTLSVRSVGLEEYGFIDED